MSTTQRPKTVEDKITIIGLMSALVAGTFITVVQINFKLLSIIQLLEQIAK